MSIKTLLGQPDKGLLYCAPQDPLKDAVRLLVRHNVNAIAVLGPQEELSGILTDQDVMQAIDAGDGELSGARVSDWMSHKVITCSPDAKLTEALQIMGRHGIRHLVVADGVVPLAVLGIRAILSKIHEHDEIEIRVLRDMAVAHRASI